MNIREVINILNKNGHFHMAKIVENLDNENTMLVTQLVDSERRNDELQDHVKELIEKNNAHAKVLAEIFLLTKHPNNG